MHHLSGCSSVSRNVCIVKASNISSWIVNLSATGRKIISSVSGKHHSELLLTVCRKEILLLAYRLINATLVSLSVPFHISLEKGH